MVTKRDVTYLEGSINNMGFKEFVVDNAPQLLIFGGATGLVGAGVLACIKTKKLEHVLDIRNGRMDAIMADNPTKGRVLKEKLITAYSVAKLYVLPAAIAGVSVYGICKGTNIFNDRSEKLAQRVLGLATAYGTLNDTHEAYVKAVREKYGDEADDILKHGIVDRTTEKTVAGEDGTEKTITENAQVITKTYKYERYFVPEETNVATRNMDYNEMTLRSRQSEWNIRIRAKYIVYLNEILLDLGFKPVDDGWTVGWIYDTKNPNASDNPIDIGIRRCLHVNEYGELVDALMICPNVQGEIIKRGIELGLIEARR